MSLKLIKALARNELRVFYRKDVERIAQSCGLSPKSIPGMLSKMVKKDDLDYLGERLYSLPIDLLVGEPLHSLEIAMRIAKKGAISYRTALSYYKLTDQVFSTVYVTVPRLPGANLSTKQSYKVRGTTYRLLRIIPKNYWGVTLHFIAGEKVWITDIEKTLIDGLTRPDLCGGFREVLYAFELALPRIEPGTIFDYAKRTSKVACKRLGWVLDELDVLQETQEQLEALPMAHAQKLDASGRIGGKVNKRWNLLENIFYEAKKTS